MQRMLKRMLVLVVVAVVPSQAEAAVRVDTYSVPVTTPDTLGSPVTLDTDVYVPDRKVPPGGFPFLEVFHGGGSTKDNSYDAGHARRLRRGRLRVADLLTPAATETRAGR